MKTMQVVLTDGGRVAAEFRGAAHDCVTRSVAIASGLPYTYVYNAMSVGMLSQRPRKGATRKPSARTGVTTKRKWFRDWMVAHGFEWTPTMHVGQGCKVRLAPGELPAGRLVVAVSKHYTAVIDGAIHDAFDPQRGGTRCVYGYWRFGPAMKTTDAKLAELRSNVEADIRGGVDSARWNSTTMLNLLDDIDTLRKGADQ